VGVNNVFTPAFFKGDSMIFGVQYYRPPFPDKKYWLDDFPNIKNAGFNTIQFWVPWGWVEPEPGRFVFDDYDELMAMALKHNLNVVLSLSAELQPYWIHRAVPDSHMVDHMGNKVISSNRSEAHQGLTPGGCTDNMEVQNLMKRFLQKIVLRYKEHPNLIGWDCWNELRWCIQSDGLVCYCKHTKQAFRQWLDARYGGLNGLNSAWKRRYSCWEDVEPGKLPGRPFTEIMEFEAFQQSKLAKHLKFRVDAIRMVDNEHIISAHEGGPPSLYGWGKMKTYGSGGHMLHALHSGNFFDMADQVDVFGSSHYPGFQTATLAEFGAGVEITRSANARGTFWISELQGHSEDPTQLSLWFWSCLARGAKAIIGWSWRNEVFGREAGSFGIYGRNDNTKDRIDVYRRIGDVIKKNEILLDAYLPDRPEVALLHDANAYNLEWADTGDTEESVYNLKGWSKALERSHIPYSFVDSGHLDALDGVKLLVMGRPSVVPPAVAERILQFIQAGGTLLIEGNADAFTSCGFYQYNGQERPFASALGIEYGPEIKINKHGPYYQLLKPGSAKPDEKIREEITLELSGEKYEIYAEGSITPLIAATHDEILAYDLKGDVFATRKTFGKGAVLALGGFLGKGYHRADNTGLERFLKDLSSQAGVIEKIVVLGGDVYWNSGMADGNRLLFLINNGQSAAVMVRISKQLLTEQPLAEDLIEGIEYTIKDCGNDWQMDLKVGRGEARLFVLKNRVKTS
jgi:beta-galactosidase